MRCSPTGQTVNEREIYIVDLIQSFEKRRLRLMERRKAMDEENQETNESLIMNRGDLKVYLIPTQYSGRCLWPPGTKS